LKKRKGIRIEEHDDLLKLHVGDTVLYLTHAEAVILLKKLAATLGYNVVSNAPVVKYTRVRGGYRVSIIESGVAKDYIVPDSLLAHYINVLSEWRRRGAKKVSKRDLASTLRKYALQHPDALDELAVLFDTEEAVWEVLVGSRNLYYKYFRAPLLLLEEKGVLDVGKGRYIIIKRLPS